MESFLVFTVVFERKDIYWTVVAGSTVVFVNEICLFILLPSTFSLVFI